MNQVKYRDKEHKKSLVFFVYMKISKWDIEQALLTTNN